MDHECKVARSRQACARGTRAEVAGALGGRWHVSFRSQQIPRSDFFHRHAAADGQRIAAHRSRILIHAYRRHRALSADARHAKCSIRWDGTTTVCRPSAACRTTTVCAAIRRCRTTRISSRRRNRRSSRSRSRVRTSSSSASTADEGRRAGVRAPVALPRLVGRLVDDLRDDRHAIAARVADRLSAPARAGPGIPARGADAVGRGLPHGCGPGRARGSRARRCVSPSAVRPSRRGAPSRSRRRVPSCCRHASPSWRTRTTSAISRCSARTC